MTLLGGPEDGDGLRAMATQIGERATVVAESGFTQTLSAVRSGCVAVGGDTGLTHLAAASGVKTIGLFDRRHRKTGSGRTAVLLSRTHFRADPAHDMVSGRAMLAARRA